MRLQVFDEDEADEDTLIDETTEKGFLRPSSDWKYLTHNGRTATVEYRIKVECDSNYYGYHCSTHCEPRDDRHGHYTCGRDGKRICMDGWKGDFCKTRE